VRDPRHSSSSAHPTRLRKCRTCAVDLAVPLQTFFRIRFLRSDAWQGLRCIYFEIQPGDGIGNLELAGIVKMLQGQRAQVHLELAKLDKLRQRRILFVKLRGLLIGMR
jgi:hypothetical protein